MLDLYIWPEYQRGRQEAALRNAPIKLSVHRRQVDSEWRITKREEEDEVPGHIEFLFFLKVFPWRCFCTIYPRYALIR